MSLWSKTMQPRFALLGVTTVAAIALLIGGAAYTSLYIFRDAPHQKINAEVRATPGQRHVFDSNRRVEYL
jgi:hypothetical protein